MNIHTRKVIAQRRTEAKMLRRYGATSMADALDGYSEDLERALRADAGDAHFGPEYEIKEAAARSGYSIAELSRKVQNGQIKNQNPAGIARVRAHDLPCRPGCIPRVLGWRDGEDDVALDDGEEPRTDQEAEHTTVEEKQSSEETALAVDGVDGEVQMDSGRDDDPDSPVTQEEYEAFRRGRRSAQPTRS